MPTDQSTFRSALLDPARPVPDGLNDGKGNRTKKRFDVYRNNVAVALIDALRTAFPIVCKLIGDQNFESLARMFIRRHPPNSPLMMHYGIDFPDFLESFEPLRHIGYLPDMARLELALRRAYHAADPQHFDAGRLMAVTPDRLMNSRLTLAAPVELLQSRWPIYDIWRYNTAENAPKPRAVTQPVLITRPEFDPTPVPLSLAEAAWCVEISAGGTLNQAQQAATEITPEFDLSPLLTRLLQDNAIAELTTPEE